LSVSPVDLKRDIIESAEIYAKSLEQSMPADLGAHGAARSRERGIACGGCGLCA